MGRIFYYLRLKYIAMKKILFSFVLLFALNNYFSQITKFGEMNSWAGGINLTKFTQYGYKYWVLDVPGFKINIYNTNLSLYKVINIPVPANTATNSYQVHYLSDMLFDTDNKIEYFVRVGINNPHIPKVYIFNETGSTLFYSDSTFISSSWNDIFQNSYTLFYDGSKAVLKLAKGISGLSTSNRTLFYALPGTIPCIECSSTGTTVGRPEYQNSNPEPTFYPNPVTDQLKLKYTLPKDFKTAEIKIQDLQGKQLDSFKVTSDFEFIYLPSNYNNGLYLYSLIVDGQLIKTEKIILDK